MNNIEPINESNEQPNSNESVESNIDYNNITIESFEDLNLKEHLLRGIYGNGYEQPSVIQRKAI